MELLNYRENCRVCLKTYNVSKNIFSHIVEGCHVPIAQVIFSLFGIELHMEQAYPQFICRKCLTEVENILLFKEELVRTEEFLFKLFKSDYPSYKEQKFEDSKNIYSSGCSAIGDFTESQNPPHFNLLTTAASPTRNVKNENSCVIKNEPCLQQNFALEQQINCKYCNKTFEVGLALEEHYVKDHSVEQTVNGSNNKRVSPRKTRKQRLKTDQIENISVECSGQKTITIQPTKNAITTGAKVISEINHIIPQASFLQNFNLITLQDAEILKTRQGPLNRTRRRLLNTKYKLPETLNPTSINISKNKSKPKKDKTPQLLKQLKTDRESEDLLKRSVNFMSRYGLRKLNDTYLKRGKVIHKDTKIVNINHVNITSDKNKGSTLGPYYSYVETIEAVIKQGCENENNLVNNNLKLESNNTDDSPVNTHNTKNKKHKKLLNDKQETEMDLVIMKNDKQEVVTSKDELYLSIPPKSFYKDTKTLKGGKTSKEIASKFSQNRLHVVLRKATNNNLNKTSSKLNHSKSLDNVTKNVNESKKQNKLSGHLSFNNFDDFSCSRDAKIKSEKEDDWKSSSSTIKSVNNSRRKETCLVKSESNGIIDKRKCKVTSIKSFSDDNSPCSQASKTNKSAPFHSKDQYSLRRTNTRCSSRDSFAKELFNMESKRIKQELLTDVLNPAIPKSESPSCKIVCAVATQKLNQNSILDLDEMDNNIGFRTKLRKVLSSDSLNCFKYDTQDADNDLNENIEDRDITTILNHNRTSNIPLKNEFPGKVWNVNVEEDQEFQLVLFSDDMKDIASDKCSPIKCKQEIKKEPDISTKSKRKRRLPVKYSPSVVRQRNSEQYKTLNQRKIKLDDLEIIEVTHSLRALTPSSKSFSIKTEKQNTKKQKT